MALDAALGQHLATLVRIGLTEEELETLREQLSHILEQFEVRGFPIREISIRAAVDCRCGGGQQ